MVVAELELYRLEQRYTKRQKRTTFISEAVYVDGEYVYPWEQKCSSSTTITSPTSPKSTGSSFGSWSRASSNVKSPAVKIRELTGSMMGKA